MRCRVEVEKGRSRPDEGTASAATTSVATARTIDMRRMLAPFGRWLLSILWSPGSAAQGSFGLRTRSVGGGSRGRGGADTNPSLDATAGWTALGSRLRPRGAVRPGVPVPRVPMRVRSLRGLFCSLRGCVRLQVGERVGETRVVWLDLQQRLVTADRVVEPGLAVARGEVRCGAGLTRGRRFCLGGLGFGAFGLGGFG